MGTLVNGIKEIFATSQSTATHLPVCASDGTPQGRISVGDLASVLGGLTNIANIQSVTEGSANDLSSNLQYKLTLYVVNSSVTDKPSGAHDGFVVAFRWGSQRMQIFSDCNGSDPLIFVRRYSGTSWSTWTNIQTGLASFYKNYNSLASLKTALGVDSICRNFYVSGATNTAFDTGISVNQGNGGLTALAVISKNIGAGTNTRSETGVYQFYYSGDNAPAFTHLSGDVDMFESYCTVTDNKTLAFVKKDDAQVFVTFVLSRPQS